MIPITRNPSLSKREIVAGWKSILSGNVPFMSIEITRECPLSCPGCYAYGPEHLGGEVTLRDLSDFRGNALVDGVLDLVREYKPLHVSLVGGEPMMRHRELSRILPALADMGVFTMVVTSGVIPIPMEWMEIPRLRVAVSVDGLPEHHDVRRKPATYVRILKNIENRSVNIHWVITRPMLERRDYLEEYVSFWSGRLEVEHIWISVYTPQIGEQSPERLTRPDRELLADELPRLARRYPKFLMNKGIANAIVHPPDESRRLRFLEDVREFLRRLAQPRRALRFWWLARLRAMRLRHQQRAALGSHRESRRSSESGAPGSRLDSNWPDDEPLPEAVRGSAPLEPRNDSKSRQRVGSD